MTRVSITRKIDVRDPSALPAWVPAEGTFANISNNTLAAIKPAGWPSSSDVAGPFANWSGGVYCSDFGSSGGYAVFGSGHLTLGTALWAGVWVFDFESQSWVGRNVPSQPLLENVSQYDAYGQSNVTATLGHPYPPHTYDGLAYVPAGGGGGSNGSLLQVSAAGSTWGTRALLFDLSSETSPPVRVRDAVAAVSDTYPATCVDTARNGAWITSGNMQGALSFLSFSDWSLTAYPGVASNVYGNTSLVYVPTRDCVIAMSSGSGGAGMVLRVCQIVSGVPQGWTLVSQTGAVPAGAPRCGGAWSTLLSKVVSYSGVPTSASNLSSGYQVSTLAIPENLTAGVWEWSTHTLTGAGGAVPVVAYDSNGNIVNNGSWSRFVEVPSARCFVYAGSVGGPVQAWRLEGM